MLTLQRLVVLAFILAGWMAEAQAEAVSRVQFKYDSACENETIAYWINGNEYLGTVHTGDGGSPARLRTGINRKMPPSPVIIDLASIQPDLASITLLRMRDPRNQKCIDAEGLPLQVTSVIANPLTDHQLE